MNFESSITTKSPAPEKTLDDMENSIQREAAAGQESRGQLQPSDQVRAVFASAIDSLKADMRGDNASKNNIAISLKSKIREILHDEVVKRKQASSVLTAASALTSLCDSDKSLPPPENGMEGTKDALVSDASKSLYDASDHRKSSGNKSRRDSIPMSFPHKVRRM